MAQIPEIADVRDDEREAKLILRAHLPEVDAAIFDGEAAAAAVVAELNDLVLQRLVFEVVADTGDEIQAFAGFAPVADERANLIRKRLLEIRRHRRRIVIQAEVPSSDKEFPIRLYFQERADGDQSLNLGVVLKNLLQIVAAAGSDLEIADDRRPVAGTESEGERRDGIERLEDVALAVDDGAAKVGIKVVFLDDVPGNQLLRLAVAVFPEEPLCKSIFDFAGVGKCGIGIEMNKVGEAIHAGDVAVGERRFDGVLVPASSLVLLQGCAVEESFERRWAELHGELAGGAESGGSGHAEPRSEVQWHGDSRRQFVPIDEIGSLNRLIAAEYDTGKGVEAEIDGGAAPRGLLDGAETGFRQVAES